jgi:hypothetical protein
VSGRGRAAARRVLSRLRAARRAGWRHWVTYWPEPACLLIAACAVRDTAHCSLRAAGRWTRTVAALVRRVGSVLWRVGPLARRWAGVAAR